MTRKAGIILGAGLLALALMIVRAKSHWPHLAAFNAENKTAQAVVPSPAPGFGKYLKSSRPGYRTTLEQDAGVPKVCLEYFDALQKIDFIGNDADQLTYQMLPKPPQDCVGEFVTGFNSVQQDYLKKCAPIENQSDQISDECISATFLIRAAVTRLALKGKPLNQITDLSQLTDLVFSELAQGANPNSMPDFKQMKSIADRMLEIDPTLYAAHKVEVMSGVMEAMMSKESNSVQSEEAFNRADAALQKAREQRPNDATLDDAELAVKTRGFDPTTTLDVSRKMTTEHPENDRGWYLMSFAQWKQGDQAGAIDYLKQAIALAPNNSEYQKIFQQISQPNANGDSFKGALSIGIGSDDFNH